MKLISCNSKRKTMGKTHKKTNRRQESIERARHSDRRMKIGAIVICAAIVITIFVAGGMQLLVPDTEAAVSADNKTRSGNVDVQKNNNSLTASKMDSVKRQNSSEDDVNAAEESSEPDKETKLDEILQSAEYPVQLKELAKKNDEAIDFIYEYPEEHSKKHDIDLTAEASQDTVPLLQQWDKRWGYEKYSGNYFAASGCGPTALSMVVLYLTHDAQASPLAVAEYAKEAGYSVDGSGSAWDLMSKGCRHYGVNAKTIKEDEVCLTQQVFYFLFFNFSICITNISINSCAAIIYTNILHAALICELSLSNCQWVLLFMILFGSFIVKPSSS